MVLENLLRALSSELMFALDRYNRIPNVILNGRRKETRTNHVHTGAVVPLSRSGDAVQKLVKLETRLLELVLALLLNGVSCTSFS